VHALTQPAAISRRLQWRIAALFFAAVVITRLPSFFLSVLDWDESLYVLMARQWQAGHLPYTTIWDNKPIGIYGIFVLFQTVFGDPVLAIRAATIAAISATAFAVFRIALLIPREENAPVAVFAGIAFIICSLSNDGLAANTEIFMACFTAFAMLFALSPNVFPLRPLTRGVFAGLLFGLAFMTKYVAVFEAPALAFALLAFTPGDTRARLAACLGAASGAAAPLLFTVLLYAAAGHLRLWWDCSIAANLLRVATPLSAGALGYVLNLQLARWLPLFCSAAILVGAAPLLLAPVLRRQAISRPALFHMFLLIWLLGGCAGVAAAKLFYDHYFLQILPVLCITLAWVLRQMPGRLSPAWRAIVFAAILAIPCFGAGSTLMGDSLPLTAPPHADTPRQIAAEFLRLPAGSPRQVYVFDYQPIIYSLAGQTPPTRYAFPSVLTKCFLAHVAGVDAAAEVHRILAGNPQFIVRSAFPLSDPAVINRAVYQEVNQDTATRYDLWRSYPDAAVYRLRPGAPPLGPAPPDACA
jgi:4-amino-4-deoxy-L-arabinose transferase-like glycosyltransferase